MIPQVDLEDAKLLEGVKLVGLADAVVVGVDPDPQVAVHSVPWVYDAVPVATVGGVIEEGQRQEAVRSAAPRLRCQIAEELGEVIDGPVAIPVERQPSISSPRVGPTDLLQRSVRTESELHAVSDAGQMIALIECIKDDGRRIAGRRGTLGAAVGAS